MSSRRILCEKCGNKVGPMHPEDVINGFHQRRVWIRKARKPDVHQIITYEDGQPISVDNLASLRCDQCNAPIPNGAPACAVTRWRGDNEPGPWEEEFQ